MDSSHLTRSIPARTAGPSRSNPLRQRNVSQTRRLLSLARVVQQGQQYGIGLSVGTPVRLAAADSASIILFAKLLHGCGCAAIGYRCRGRSLYGNPLLPDAERRSSVPVPPLPVAPPGAAGAAVADDQPTLAAVTAGPAVPSVTE